MQREGLAKAFDQDIAIFDQIAQKFPNERQFFASMQVGPDSSAQRHCR